MNYSSSGYFAFPTEQPIKYHLGFQADVRYSCYVPAIFPAVAYGDSWTKNKRLTSNAGNSEIYFKKHTAQSTVL
jgi:hypothetical protein